MRHSSAEAAAPDYQQHAEHPRQLQHPQQQHGQYVIARVSTCGPRGRPRSLSLNGSGGVSGGSISCGEAGGGASGDGGGGLPKRVRLSAPAAPGPLPAAAASPSLFGMPGGAAPPPLHHQYADDDEDGCSRPAATPRLGAAVAGSASPMLLDDPRPHGCRGRLGVQAAAAAASFGAHANVSPFEDAGQGRDQDEGGCVMEEDPLGSDLLIDTLAAAPPALLGQISPTPPPPMAFDADCAGAAAAAAAAGGTAAVAAASPEVLAQHPAPLDLERDVAWLLQDDDWAAPPPSNPRPGARGAEVGGLGGKLCAAGGGLAASCAPMAPAAASGGAGSTDSDSPTCSGTQLELLGGWDLEVNRSTPGPELLADLQAAAAAGGAGAVCSGRPKCPGAAAVRVRCSSSGTTDAAAAGGATAAAAAVAAESDAAPAAGAPRLVALRALCGAGAGGVGDAGAVREQLARTLEELEAARREAAAQRRLAADKDSQVQQVLRELVDIRQQVKALQLAHQGAAPGAPAAASASARAEALGAPAGGGRLDEDSSGEQGSEAGGLPRSGGGGGGPAAAQQITQAQARSALLQGLTAATAAAVVAEEQQEISALRAQNHALRRQVAEARASSISVAGAVLRALLASPELSEREKQRVSAEMSALLLRAQTAVGPSL